MFPLFLILYIFFLNFFLKQENESQSSSNHLKITLIEYKKKVSKKSLTWFCFEAFESFGCHLKESIKRRWISMTLVFTWFAFFTAIPAMSAGMRTRNSTMWRARTVCSNSATAQNRVFHKIAHSQTSKSGVVDKRMRPRLSFSDSIMQAKLWFSNFDFKNCVLN